MQKALAPGAPPQNAIGELTALLQVVYISVAYKCVHRSLRCDARDGLLQE